MKKTGTLLAAVVFACGAHSAATAQDPANQAEAIPSVSAIAACRALTDPSARLACYDRAAPPFVDAAQDGRVKILDAAEAKAVRRSLFGFNLPKINLFKGGGDGNEAQDEFKTLNTTVTAVRSLPDRRIQFTIEDGDATWQSSDPYPSLLTEPRVGMKVELERAALGSYWIRFDRQRGIKGHRIR